MRWWVLWSIDGLACFGGITSICFRSGFASSSGHSSLDTSGNRGSSIDEFDTTQTAAFHLFLVWNWLNCRKERGCGNTGLAFGWPKGSGYSVLTTTYYVPPNLIYKHTAPFSSVEKPTIVCVYFEGSPKNVSLCKGHVKDFQSSLPTGAPTVWYIALIRMTTIYYMTCTSRLAAIRRLFSRYWQSSWPVNKPYIGTLCRCWTPSVLPYHRIKAKKRSLYCCL